MLGMFEKVTPFIAPKPKIKAPRPDNLVFRLHYRVSPPFLQVGKKMNWFQYELENDSCTVNSSRATLMIIHPI